MNKKKIVIVVVSVFLVVAIAVGVISILPETAKNMATADSMEMGMISPQSADYSYKTQKTESITRLTNSIENSKAQIKKITKNANITIEVNNLEQDFDKISKWVLANGGYEFSRDFSNNEYDKRISVVYKISPNNLDSFIKFLTGSGKISNSNISSEDITEQYYDTAARLQNLREGREQFIQIQKKAVTITDILKVQNELTTITGEIESLESSLKLWDKMVAESTVRLSITEKNGAIKVKNDETFNFSTPADIFRTMKNGFIWTSNFVVKIILIALIAIVSLIPVGILAGIIILIIKLVKRFRK